MSADTEHSRSLGAVAVLVTTLLSLSGKVPAGYAGLTITSGALSPFSFRSSFAQMFFVTHEQ